jgi:hypothetical protein
MSFFKKMEKSIIKLIWKYKRPQEAKAILSQKSNTGGITTTDHELYYKAMVKMNPNGTGTKVNTKTSGIENKM